MTCRAQGTRNNGVEIWQESAEVRVVVGEIENIDGRRRAMLDSSRHHQDSSSRTLEHAMPILEIAKRVLWPKLLRATLLHHHTAILK